MRPNIDKYKFIIFDFDGVIVDSLGVKTEAFGQLFSSYGRDIALKVKQYHLNNGGISRYEKFKYYYKSLLNKKINKSITRRLDKKYSDLVLTRVASAAYIKGALEFIKKCNKDKKSCFIISATPEKELRRIVKLKKIQPLFKIVLGSPKNKSDNLKYLLKKFSINSADVVYFGDAVSDFQAAKNNRICFIGIVNKKSRELKGIKGRPTIRDFTCFG
jgi:HAD superfamily hydrolase (TIGR01549 family)